MFCCVYCSSSVHIYRRCGRTCSYYMNSVRWFLVNSCRKGKKNILNYIWTWIKVDNDELKSVREVKKILITTIIAREL